jgi:hypothetical protein
MRDVLARASNDTTTITTTYHRHGESNSGRDDGDGKVERGDSPQKRVLHYTQLASSSYPNDSRLTGQITVPVRIAMMHRHLYFFFFFLSSSFFLLPFRITHFSWFIRTFFFLLFSTLHLLN